MSTTIKLVEVNIDGAWFPAELLGQYRAPAGWRCIVRWTKGPGDRYQGSVWASDVRERPHG